MQRLQPEIIKNGFTYSLVVRGNRACLYEQHISTRVKSYEVFLIQLKPAQELNGTRYPEREVFPGNADFGYTAWAVRDFERALKK